MDAVGECGQVEGSADGVGGNGGRAAAFIC